jgi:serine/threonine protein kinase
LEKKKSTTERPTSSPYPETTYSTHLRNNKPVEEYQGKETAQLVAFLNNPSGQVTVKNIGQPRQGAQAAVKFIELYSPNHTRKLPAAYKQGKKAVENEIKIYKAIAANSRYDTIKAFLSRPFLYTKNENPFFYSRLQKNGDLSHYCDYITQQAENSTTSAYLFNQFRRLVELLSFLHNETFSDANKTTHHGITHGDINFRNIFLDEKGNFLLSDFGCAYFADGPLDYLGMLLQISPELHMAASRCYTEKVQDSSKSDIWAVGLILVQLLTGQFPLQKAPFKSLLTIDEQTPFCQQAKNANGYLQPQAVESSHFLSDNLCGQALRIEWAKGYPESTLCRDAFEANNLIKNLLHKPNQPITTHEILINLGHMMLLPEHDRPSAEQLKTIMYRLAPYFSDDEKAIANFVSNMFLGNSSTAPRPLFCSGHKTL